MKNIIYVFALFFFSVSVAFAQVTDNPSIARKSVTDTYINKIEITDRYTIISMKHVSKTRDQVFDEYFKANPEQLRALRQMSQSQQQQALQRLEGSFDFTISFYPSSFIKTRDGQRYKFLKASGIPVAPETQKTGWDKRYYFTVYFEKIAPGYESVDIIENEVGQQGTQSFWNFYGVQVNNPAVPVATRQPERSTERPTGNVSIQLSGRVIDAQTNQPIAAKIVCIARDSNAAYDSLTTSMSGNYSFTVAPADYLYIISAKGYTTSEESFDLGYLQSNKSFTRDFMLEPLGMASEVPPMINDQAHPEAVIAENPNRRPQEKNEPEAVVEGKPIRPEPVPEVLKPTRPEVQPEVVNENTFRLDKVYFKVGEAVILQESYDQLEGLVDMMKQRPTMQIRLEGHTDNQGNSDLNQKLSLQRAFTVREYLMSNGIDGGRVKFVGYGDTRPISPNNNEANRRKNRRVEFVIL